MIRPSAIRSAWTIIWAIWRRHQRSIIGLLAITFLFGWIFRATPGSEVIQTIGNLGMGLSLFLTFVICGFTEGDRKARSWGFSARLFTLPVSTPTLIAAPMLFGVVTIGLVYFVWAGFALSAQGLPLTWPLLYLGVGMICYQCILWSMARYRVTRIVVLGYTGALFAMGWLVFRSGGGEASSLDWISATPLADCFTGCSSPWPQSLSGSLGSLWARNGGEALDAGAATNLRAQLGQIR